MNTYRFSELHPGLTAGFEVSITETMVDQFRALSGDENPLHQDVEYAKEKGYPDRVVFGMLSASLLSRLAGVYLPGKYCLLQGLKLDFVNPVFVGDELKVEGKVTHLNEAFRQIEVAITIRNQSGAKVLRGKFKAGVDAE